MNNLELFNDVEEQIGFEEDMIRRTVNVELGLEVNHREDSELKKRWIATTLKSFNLLIEKIFISHFGQNLIAITARSSGCSRYRAV